MPPVSSAPSPRAAADRCPGALRPHRAADGALVRVRLPGGQVGPAALRALADAAALGDGSLELTSRANVQIRGLKSDAAVAEVAERCADAGLLPSATHERVRNILGSPLSGRRPGTADIRPLVRDLDAAVCADPVLAELPGRFLFAVDDGRGDVAGFDADVAWQAPDRLLLAGSDVGLRVPAGGAVAAMVAAARAFLAAGGGSDGSWRLRDLPAGVGRVASALGLDTVPVGAEPTAGGAPVVGLRTDPGSAWAVLAVPLGRLTMVQGHLLADAAAGGALVVTPWRQVVVDLPVDRAVDALAALVGAGLIADPASPWIGISACAGTGGCENALADVRADARSLAYGPAGGAGSRAPAYGPAGAVHWAGCDRRCGQPTGPVLVAVATGDGYLVHRPDAEPVSVGPSAARDIAADWRRSR